MSVQLEAISFDVADPDAVGAFWAELLCRGVIAGPAGVTVPGDRRQVGLRFVRSERAGRTPNRLHLHVTSSSAEDQGRTVERVQELGGRRRGTGPLPMGRVLYVADPDGAGFCVTEPGNAYLEGCGPLGEVTCDGSPGVGRFWSAALGWPIVWDRDEQIAIQSPAGGTKVAWDVWPDSATLDRSRQRFELSAGDVEEEVARLVGLGAVRRRTDGAVVTLEDPDGVEFTVRGDVG